MSRTYEHPAHFREHVARPNGHHIGHHRDPTNWTGLGKAICLDDVAAMRTFDRRIDECLGDPARRPDMVATRMQRTYTI